MTIPIKVIRIVEDLPPAERGRYAVDRWSAIYDSLPADGRWAVVLEDDPSTISRRRASWNTDAKRKGVQLAARRTTLYARRAVSA